MPVAKPTVSRPQAPRANPVAQASARVKSNGAGEPGPREIYEMIAQAAYYRAEKRGFAPGHEQEDWALAEAEVKQLLRDR